ncbi:MAG: FAD-dependent oxidoreductase [Gammaproteobacteria bacterium]|jgi:sulfide:quinone oxidoreductase
MKKITVLGSGFAALTAVRSLRKKDNSCEITLVSASDSFVYLPSLIWFPNGKRNAHDITVPLANFFKKYNVLHHKGHVTGLENGGRTVMTTAGKVENDGLIIATGGRFIKKLPGIENIITPCEGIAIGEKIKEKLDALKSGTIAIGFASNPKEPSAMRGGPMFEFLFGIDQLLRKQKRREQFKIIFFCPAPKPGIRMGEKAVEGLLKRMKKCNIETHLGHKMVGFEANKVKTEGGEFDADLILFMPGMTGNMWFKDSPLPLSEGGLIRANSNCKVEEMSAVYVAGDSGSFSGPDWMPKQAHMADLQAQAASENLLNELQKKPANATFKPELMCIVDSNDKGVLTVRTPKRNFATPPLRIFHWAKVLFEWWYLRKLR